MGLSRINKYGLRPDLGADIELAGGFEASMFDAKMSFS